MPRIVSTVLVLGLLAGTAAAFALTEGLKLERTPVFRTQVSKVFSPVCRCETARARIFFQLRKRETVRVSIEGKGREVRRLVHRRYRPGRVELFWDGRAEDGSVAPDGTYLPVVRLERSHRTIRLPNPIEVDTRPPRVEAVAVSPRVFSPDGDGRADRVVLSYRLDERAHAILYVDGRRSGYTYFQRPVDRLTWFGKVRGRAVPSGVYRISLGAQDLAGNVGRARAVGTVVVRYVALGRSVVRVAAGERLALRVSTDAPTVRWLLAGRSGTARRGTLRIRAPREPGRYTLFVSANGHAARASVIVE